MLRYVETPKDQPATVDALILSDSGIKAVVETKCRYNVAIDFFMTVFNGEWLVTLDKIIDASRTAKLLGVPLVGFLYLVKDKTLLVQRIANPDGRFTAEMKIRTTKTQTTINGGEIERTNAFIDMRHAQILKGDE